MPRAATGKGKQMLLGRRLTCGLVLGSALALGAVCWSSSSIAGGATARGGMTIRLFYVALADNGRSGFRIGCGDSLVPVKRTIPPTPAPLTAALRLLLSDHRRTYGQSGLYNALYRSRLTLKRAVVVGGTAFISLIGRTVLGGECDDPRFKAQIVRTARQFPPVRAVAVFINGRPMSRVIGGKG